MSTLNKILFTAFDFPPNIGGVATYGHELVNTFRNDFQKEVRVLTKKRDQLKSTDTVKQLALPNSGLMSVLPYTYHLIQNIREFQPDAIYSSLWLPDGISALLAKKILKIDTPLFCGVHGMEILDSQQNWKKKTRQALSFLKPWYFKNCSQIFPVSNYTKSKLIELGAPKDKLTVVPNGVNSKVFTKRQVNSRFIQKHKVQGRLVFFSLCRHVPHKGIDKVIKALAPLANHPCKWTYLIGGSGPGTEHYKNMVKRIGFNKEQVQFLGRIPQAEIIDYYNLADVFIMLSREEPRIPSVEGFGIVFAEAAACGVPSIGGRSGGVEDAIIDGKTGWLIDPTDAKEATNILQKVLDNPQQIEILANNALKRAKEDLNWNKISGKILSTMSKA